MEERLVDYIKGYAVYGGGKRSWRLQGDFTLKKENENWKFTSSRASTY